MPVRRDKLVIPDATSVKGSATNGEVYDTVSDLWNKEICKEDGSVDEEKRQQWYKKGVDYWLSIDASVDGVLGGFGHVSKVDIKGSREFLNMLGRVNFNGAAVECGAGIGRTSAGLLTPFFQKVDLVEPAAHFVAKAKELLKDNTKMDTYYQCGLEEWQPVSGKYTFIWCQWVLPHLTDDDLVEFFKKCIPALTADGIIGVKENTSAGEFIMDKEDTSVTRTDEQYRAIFHRAGLRLLATKMQSGFPKQLLPVRMYALVPDTKKTEEPQA